MDFAMGDLFCGILKIHHIKNGRKNIYRIEGGFFMKKYRCIKPFPLDRIDESGHKVWGDPIIIEAGMEFFETFCDGIVVHLETDDGLWIEIHPKMLEVFFEEV